MSGHRQYQRLAKPMGMVDLDENEFDNFLKLKRKGGILDRLSKCSKKAKTSRFASKEAKKDFMKECMKKSGVKDSKAIKMKTEKLVSKVKEKMKKTAEKNKVAELEKRKAPITEQSIPRPNLSDNTTTTPPTSPSPSTGTGKNKKLLLYGAIGVVALIIGLKIIKK